MMNAVAAASHITERQELQHVAEALRSVASFLSSIDCQGAGITHSPGGGATTAEDRDINYIVPAIFRRRDEGWLSDESADDHKRLQCGRIWTVDPLDGRREFHSGISEWCVFNGLFERGRAAAGGVLDPSFEESAVKLKLANSIAYRVAQAAAQHASATCTFEPRHEWDIPGGVALVKATGGAVHTLRGGSLTFDRQSPLLHGLIAFSASCQEQVPSLFSGEI